MGGWKILMYSVVLNPNGIHNMLFNSKTRQKIVDGRINKDPHHKTSLSRVRKEARDAVYDLTLIAEKLPEDQQKQIFTAESLEPFFTAILTMHEEPDVKSRELEEQRERIRQICRTLLTVLVEQGSKVVDKKIYDAILIDRRGGGFPAKTSALVIALGLGMY
jgi:hypothetical protein